jgi:hypothetical protein
MPVPVLQVNCTSEQVVALAVSFNRSNQGSNLPICRACRAVWQVHDGLYPAAYAKEGCKRLTANDQEYSQ